MIQVRGVYKMICGYSYPKTLMDLDNVKDNVNFSCFFVENRSRFTMSLHLKKMSYNRQHTFYFYRIRLDIKTCFLRIRCWNMKVIKFQQAQYSNFGE